MPVSPMRKLPIEDAGEFAVFHQIVAGAEIAVTQHKARRIGGVFADPLQHIFERWTLFGNTIEQALHCDAFGNPRPLSSEVEGEYRRWLTTVFLENPMRMAPAIIVDE